MGPITLSYNPLYLQVKDILLKRIADGEYGPGEAIPSESKLASDFGTGTDANGGQRTHGKWLSDGMAQIGISWAF